MIRVVRITGEGFNLENGAQEPKAIVLSNGDKEISVPVDDDSINALLHLVYHSPENTKADVVELRQDAEVEEVDEEVVESAYRDPKSGTASI
jgi:hypothetical protein